MKKLIGISTSQIITRYGEFESLDIVKTIGADCVDYGLDMPCYNVTNPDSVYAKGDKAVIEHFSKIKSYADSLGLIINQTHGRCNRFTLENGPDDIYFENARLDCLATSVLGASVCVVHNVDLDPNFERKVHYDMAFKLFEGIFPYADEYGIKIATETFGDNPDWHQNDFFGKAEEFIGFFNYVKQNSKYADLFTMCMDTGHSNKASRFEGEPSVAELIRKCGKDITVLHLHDNNSVDDEHKVPYCGTINWKEVIEALDDIGFDGIYNLELNLTHFGPDSKIIEAELGIKVLRNILEHYSK